MYARSPPTTYPTLRNAMRACSQAICYLFHSVLSFSMKIVSNISLESIILMLKPLLAERLFPLSFWGT